MGPKRDIVKGWAEACKKYGLPLGVSVHASHAWCWYESSRGSDSKGPLAGVRYDGWLTKADITVKSLGQKTAQNKRRIKSVTLLGSTEAVTWQQTKDALTITKPQAVPSPEAVVFKVTFK